MKRRHRFSALAAVGAVAMLALTGCGRQPGPGKTVSSPEKTSEPAQTTEATVSEQSGEEPYNVRMILTVPSEVPSGLDRIVSAVNELTMRDVNMTLTLEVLPFTTFFQQIPLILSGEKADIVSCVSAMAPPFVAQGMLLDIGPLIDEYGQGIVDSFGGDEAMAKACNINGQIYGVPLHKDVSTQTSFFFRKDIVDKYGLDVSSVETLADLDALFTQVSVEEPDMWMLAADNTSNGVAVQMDILGDRLGVLEDPLNSTEIVNIVETDEFKEFCTYMHKWYENGWINQGAASDTESYYSYIKSGQAFAFISNYGHPLSKSDQEANCGGTELVMVTAGEPVCSTTSTCTWVYSVPSSSERPEKAVEMIAYLMNSKEANNLLNWGIEGEDWTENNGMAGFPEGKTAADVSYHLNCGWQLPNQFLCDVWEGQPADIYQQMEKYNSGSRKSLALGFTFDNTNVANEVAASNNVVGKYFKALVCGAVDPDKTIPEFTKELKDAGFEAILAEKQKQLDAFLALK